VNKNRSDTRSNQNNLGTKRSDNKEKEEQKRGATGMDYRMRRVEHTE
jgi:hypothetical protein